MVSGGLEINNTCGFSRLESQLNKRRTSINWPQTVSLMLLAAGAAVWYAWRTQMDMTAPLDIDGWGLLVGRLKAQGKGLELLFREPSLHRGPVIPFIFGLLYYCVPFDNAIILGNILAFGIAAGCLFVGFHYLGVSRIASAIAIILWIISLYAHKYVFGYYFAEPVVSLLSSVLFLLVIQAALGEKHWLALLCGLTAGVLLLARAPFLVVICGVPLIFRIQSVKHYGRKITLFCLGLLLIYLPWPIRNYYVYKAFIPFTTLGGEVLFQGTFQNGDDDVHNNLRQYPEFARIKNEVLLLSEIDQNQYWTRRAIEQIREDPIGQVRLLTKKMLRFWVYLPAHSWVPSLKTLLMSTAFLPLAVFGAWQGRRRFIVQLCVLWVCGLWFFHSLVHTELRYNFPVLPMMFMLAMIGVGVVAEGKLERVLGRISAAEALSIFDISK